MSPGGETFGERGIEGAWRAARPPGRASRGIAGTGDGAGGYVGAESNGEVDTENGRVNRMNARWSAPSWVAVLAAALVVGAGACGAEAPESGANRAGARSADRAGDDAAAMAVSPAPPSATSPPAPAERLAASSPAEATETAAAPEASSPSERAAASPQSGPSPAGPSPAGTSPAEPPADSTAAILRATASRYERVTSMQSDFVQVLENTLLGQTTRSRGTMYQKEPGYFLMRFSEPEGDRIVSDGRYFWLYFPSTDPKQVIRTPRGTQGLDLRSQFMGDPVQRFAATYEGRAQVDGRSADVVTLVPRAESGYQRLKVWIDRGDHLVRRFELTEGNGVVRHFDLSGLVINPSLPDRLFQFSPPAGAQVIERG